jgi:hypothetical protein
MRPCPQYGGCEGHESPKRSVARTVTTLLIAFASTVVIALAGWSSPFGLAEVSAPGTTAVAR